MLIKGEVSGVSPTCRTPTSASTTSRFHRPRRSSGLSDQIIEEAETAERVGFDGIFIPERHGRPETFAPSPLTVATAIAARTSKVTIATTVSLPTLYNPMHLADQIAMIDNLSGGRFVFGAGVGYHQGHHQTFGVPWKRRARRFEEAMEVIVLALTEDHFSYEGEYEDVQLTPKGYQRPRPPIWIGAHAPGKPVDRSLDYEGWVLWTQPPWEETGPWIREMRQRAAERGKTDWTVVVDQDGWLGDDAKAVRERHSPRWLREARFYEEQDFPGEIDPAGDINQAVGAEKALQDFETRQMHFGTPESWVERIGAVKEQLAPDWLNIRTRGPRAEYGPDYPTPDESLEVIERFGNEVISRCR